MRLKKELNFKPFIKKCGICGSRFTTEVIIRKGFSVTHIDYCSKCDCSIKDIYDISDLGYDF